MAVNLPGDKGFGYRNTIGYSPCPNDTFMFNAIAQGATRIHGYRFQPMIHESRFTFEYAGLKSVVDLGAWWEEQTAMPIPLGGIVAKTGLGNPLIKKIDTSIAQARTSPEETLPYVRQHAQEMEEAVLTAHIQTFVNDFSLTMPPVGMKAIETSDVGQHCRRPNQRTVVNLQWSII